MWNKGILHKNKKKIWVFVSENRVLFFKKSEVIFTKWCFIFVLFFDKSNYDHWNWSSEEQYAKALQLWNITEV